MVNFWISLPPPMFGAVPPAGCSNTSWHAHECHPVAPRRERRLRDGFTAYLTAGAAEGEWGDEPPDAAAAAGDGGGAPPLSSAAAGDGAGRQRQPSPFARSGSRRG